MAEDPKQLLLGTVVPIIGGLVAIFMYASPLKACATARKQQHLGELNPLPFAVTFASTACWCAYGFAAPDYNMFLPNIPGFAAAIFTTVSCYALASIKVQNILLSIMCGSATVILLLGVLTRFVMAAQQARLMWGIVCNIITVVYYTAPVSSAVKVVRTRNSASIYRPTCLANLVNAALWVAYGAAVNDPFIWVPNGIGGIMSIFLIALTLIYPARLPSPSSGGLAAPLNTSAKSSSNGSSIALLVDASAQAQAAAPVEACSVKAAAYIPGSAHHSAPENPGSCNCILPEAAAAAGSSKSSTSMSSQPLLRVRRSAS